MNDIIIPQKLLNREEKRRIRISSMGKDLMWCWNEIKNPIEVDERLKRVFDLGQLVEQYLLQNNPDVYNKDLKVHTGLYFEGEEITGEIDCMFKDNGIEYICDVKTMSQNSFDKFVQAQDVKESHYQYYVQIQLYMHFLKVEDGFIWGYNKNNSEMAKVFVVYDEEFALEQVERMKKLIILLESDIEPELEYPNKTIIKTTKVRNAESYKSEGFAQIRTHKFNRFNPYINLGDNTIIELDNKGQIYSEREPEWK